MLKNTLCSIIAIASVFIAGCASVPMSSAEEDAAKKQFTAPSSGKSGLYIYRNSIFNEDELSDLNFNENLDNLFKEPVRHNFSVKFIYYLDYNKIKSWL